ncbi:transporter substrate-binding domain-containing protein [Colwellia sp. 1_MG-2023]|uniref:substrate-binding periplasmic protein n=1 Tax=unclassified Colwellia TaxID=196834 RepID=UPI001C07F111|nr:MULTISPECIES: transporter substrate-binding domain-containing protein [unclassified Colwellia]MBU2925400.1 transporter substrate-binding domain-containing protein [Colwellia sp. C2M11]MDO6489480.1 transporter substrate-binding domain-containing protein [Colwellia sp. 6_MG-2023]MDO6653470.1 transporter substrate-binding domain-containing protein [Colwellia sp. 3_MG-2023]MDO6666272.1 transporter substrate-binding domain-containing protein [Colwellia sp. 2_MG-2023]MDO6690627.1 transporter subs
MHINRDLINNLIICVMIFSANIQAKELTILTEHLAPFQIVDKNEISGISTEIVEATLKNSSFDYNIEAYPWSLSYNRALHEEDTCIYSIGRIPERELLFNWVGQIISSTVSMYSLASSTIKISTLNDAKKYKTAVIRDDVTHHFLLSKGFIENKNLYVMDNYDSLLQLLEKPSRNIDLVVLNDDLILHRVKSTEAASKYKSVYSVQDFTLDFHFACSITTEQHVVAELKKIMQKLEQEGILPAIRKKWTPIMFNTLD